jgi:hypothetical protein
VRCDYPECRSDDADPLPDPFDAYALCGRCRTWRYLYFLILVISRRVHRLTPVEGGK